MGPKSIYVLLITAAEKKTKRILELLKIGISKQVDIRALSIAAGFPLGSVRCKLLLVLNNVEGKIEKHVHRSMHRHKTHSEFFVYTKESVAELDSIISSLETGLGISRISLASLK